MLVKKYFYKTADVLSEDGKSMRIAGTIPLRNGYMNEVFYKLYKEQIEDFKTTGKTALLYIAGACEHHSTSRNFNLTKDGVMPVKSQLGYIASKVAKRIGNISYLSINANACASSMYALKEAQDLLDQGFDDVIIYGEEWVEAVELKLFEQLGINLVCSDGFFILQLSNQRSNNQEPYIGNVNWVWNEDKSPFEITKEGYMKAMAPFNLYNLYAVKMHGSGTAQNTAAEEQAIKELFGDVKTIEYKSKIGHSQGVSTGIELCMLLDENLKEDTRVLINASGLGNFYGSCYVKI